MSILRSEYVTERYGSNNQGFYWTFVSIKHQIKNNYYNKYAVNTYIYLLIKSILDQKYISIRGNYSIHILSPNCNKYIISGTEFNISQLSKNINIKTLKESDILLINIEIRSYGQKILQFVRNNCKTSSFRNINNPKDCIEEKSIL